jgi:hypothetical protein
VGEGAAAGDGGEEVYFALVADALEQAEAAYHAIDGDTDRRLEPVAGTEPLLDPWILALQVIDHFPDVVPVYGDGGFASGQVTHQRRNPDCGHTKGDP